MALLSKTFYVVYKSPEALYHTLSEIEKAGEISLVGLPALPRHYSVIVVLGLTSGENWMVRGRPGSAGIVLDSAFRDQSWRDFVQKVRAKRPGTARIAIEPPEISSKPPVCFVPLARRSTPPGGSESRHQKVFDRRGTARTVRNAAPITPKSDARTVQPAEAVELKRIALKRVSADSLTREDGPTRRHRELMGIVREYKDLEKAKQPAAAERKRQAELRTLILLTLEEEAKRKDPVRVIQQRDPQLPLLVEVCYPDLASFYSGLAINMTRGGLYLRTDTLLNLGTKVELQLLIPDEHIDLSLKASVVWATPKWLGGLPPGMGLKLDLKAGEDQALVDSFLKLLLEKQS